MSIPLSATGVSTPSSMPPSDFYVQVDTSALEQRFALLPQQMALAARRAAVRTRDWLMTHLRRELAAKAQIPTRALTGRFRRRGNNYSDAGYAVLWIGLNAIEAQAAGTPKAAPSRKNIKGIRVGKHYFDRAFYTHIYGPNQPEKVWRRKTFGKGSKRFPVVKMTIPINDHMEELLAKYEGPVAARFAQRLQHEVEFLLGLTGAA